MHTEFFVNITATTAEAARQALETGVFQGRELINGSLLTSLAFKTGLAYIFPYGDKIITLGVLLFAISTVISWSFYGDRSTEYLFGEGAIPIYRGFYILFVFIGAKLRSYLVIWRCRPGIHDIP